MNAIIQHPAVRAAKSFIARVDWKTLTERARRQADNRARRVSPFTPALPPPGVVPDGAPSLAMDSSLATWGADNYWGGGAAGMAFAEGLEFLGYPYLSQLAQRPEYRRIVEVTATEMTRKWIMLEGPDAKVKQLQEEMERLDVQGAFRKIAEQDGFFGRGHLYIDTGEGDDLAELQTTIGNGQSEISVAKVSPDRPVRALKPIEALWTYPTNYNSSDPLADDWYRPTMWFVMGKQVHASRILRFIGREVPDLLKPAYSFGGLSLTQMAKPYVDNWLETRQSVNDIISAYSQMVLKTDMSEQLQEGGEKLFQRLDLFNELRNNRGVMALDMANEDFMNVSAPLSGLHELQAQAQEHMAAVSGIPIVKLLGIQPAGLNASSEGELRAFYDWIAACQQWLFKAGLHKVICFLQLSLWGKVDAEITFKFVSLFALDEMQQATVEKTRAETDQIRIDSGVIDAEDTRTQVASRPDTPYPGMDPDDVPDLQEEEMAGLEPQGGRPQPLTEKAAEKEGEVDKSDTHKSDKAAADMALDAEFNESDHPRAPDGKFGTSSASYGSGNSFKEASSGSVKYTDQIPSSARAKGKFDFATPDGSIEAKCNYAVIENGDKVDIVLSDIKVRKWRSATETWETSSLDDIGPVARRMIIREFSQNAHDRSETIAEEMNIDREWRSMSSEQRIAWKKNETEKKANTETEREAMVDNLVRDLRATGWKPDLDAAGQVTNIPREVRMQAASPAAQAILMSKLASDE